MGKENHGEDVSPLYRQISDSVFSEIQEGKRKKGMRLPSEVAMSGLWSVSVGTVKKAYADLESRGCIYKIRGGGAYISGTYVKDDEQDARAPESVVAQTVRELSRNGLRMNQIFSVIQSQNEAVFRGEQRLQAAFIDCNMETIHHVMADLEQISGLDVEPYLIDELLSGEKVIDSRCRLALVPQKHFAEFIRYGDSIRLKVEEISLRESRGTIARLAVIPDCQDICVIYRSRRFLDSVQYTLKRMDKKNRLICINEQQFTEADERYVEDKLPMIIPPDFLNYSGAGILQIIGRAKKVGGLLVPFEFEIDKGSLLHLKQVTENIRAREAAFAYDI